MTQNDNRPKRHHYIPQMMLRHFADNDGQLSFWRRDFAKGDARKTNTQNLFVEKDLYTFTAADGTKDVALETFFSRLEGAGAIFIIQLADIIRRGEDSIAELCCREGIAQSVHYKWSKDFMEAPAGRRHFARRQQ